MFITQPMLSKYLLPFSTFDTWCSLTSGRNNFMRFVSNIGLALTEARGKLNPELQSKVVVALKVDDDTNTGLVTDIKEKLRELNMVKIIYITTSGDPLEQ